MLALLSTSVAILKGPLEVIGLRRSRGGTLCGKALSGASSHGQERL